MECSRPPVATLSVTNMRAWCVLLGVLVSATVEVTSPRELLSELDPQLDTNEESVRIESTVATFGTPPYGARIHGVAFFHPEDNFACAPLDHIEVKKDVVPVLLADRGNCTFAMKARYTQNAGYRALIIIDNRDENVTEVIMTDNGSGRHIVIPVLMISQADGNKMKKYSSRDPSEVTLLLSFNIEKRRVPSLRFVYSSDNVKAVSFLAKFSNFAQRFNHSSLELHLHFALWFDVEAEKDNFTKPVDDCVSGGRYCAPDPDGDGPAHGRDVVLEDLRQLCLLESLQGENSDAQWFQYIKLFNATCLLKDFTEDCSKKVMKKLSIHTKGIESCVSSSFGGSDDIARHGNELLRKQVRMWKNLGLEFYPAILINSRNYHGEWDGQQLLQTLCDASLEPPGFCPMPQTQSAVIRTGTVVLVAAVSFLLVIAVLVLYRAWVKRELKLEMRQQVNIAVSQYYAFNGEGSQMAEVRTLK